MRFRSTRGSFLERLWLRRLECGCGLSCGRGEAAADGCYAAQLEAGRPGEAALLGGPRKVKEVLERMRVTGSSRAVWPVLEIAGRIVWMKGVELEPERGIAVVATAL